jgi:2'-5' RNA ligase
MTTLNSLNDPANTPVFFVVDEGGTPPIPGTEESGGYTEEEAYAILTGQSLVAATYDDVIEGDTDEPDGDDDSDADVANDQIGVGAMVALIPSAADIGRLVLAGGEAPEELHLTICYLGDAALIDPATQMALLSAVTEVSLNQAAVMATGFGAAVWNPQGDKPCTIMNVGDDCGGLEGAKCAIMDAIDSVWALGYPEQHSPWVPHIALAYSDDPGLLQQALQLVGPITFDRVRVVFGSQVSDLPLYASDVVTMGGTMDQSLTAAAPVTGDGGVGGIGNTNLPGTPQSSGGLDFASEQPWYGVLVVEGVQTGDGRMFAEGSLTWPEMPLPLSWQRENLGEHTGSVISGRIDNVWRDPVTSSIIWGNGVFDSAGVDGAEAQRQVDKQFLRGVSVDVDSVNDSDVELVFPPSDGDPMEDMFAVPELMIFNNGRIRGATQCALPAFVEAAIQLGTMDPPGMAAIPTSAPVASGAGASSVDEVWNGLAEDALIASTMSLDVASAAFAWTDLAKARSGAVHKLHSRFLHHHVDKTGKVGAANVTACSIGVGQLLSNPRLSMSMSDRKAAYDHLATHLKQSGLTPQAFTVEGLTDDVRALYASAALNTPEMGPPDAAFADPEFKEPTPVSITASGEWQIIKGHAALFGTCHMSFPNACVTAPYEEVHDHYRLGEVVTASGERVAVGPITLGTGHAATVGLDPRRAAEHYDNTGTCVALVASGNDEFGIWVAGVVKPGTPPGRVMELAGAKLSGDWRRIGGALRLVAMLAVNTPGFPVPRLKAHVTDGRQTSLVAAGLMPDATVLRSAKEQLAINAMKASLARRIGRDPQTLAQKLRARVHGTG